MHLCGGTLEDAGAGAKDGFGEEIPGYANAWLQIGPIRVVGTARTAGGEQAASINCGRWIRIWIFGMRLVVGLLQFVPAGDDLVAERVLHRAIEAGIHAVESLAAGELDILAQAQIARKIGRDLPVVLIVESPLVAG